MTKWTRKRFDCKNRVCPYLEKVFCAPRFEQQHMLPRKNREATPPKPRRSDTQSRFITRQKKVFCFSLYGEPNLPQSIGGKRDWERGNFWKSGKGNLADFDAPFFPPYSSKFVTNQSLGEIFRLPGMKGATGALERH